MKNVLILRYGEMFLKGNNKSYFENTLIKNLKEKILAYKCNVNKISGRVIVSNYDIQNENGILDEITKVFGLVSVSKAVELETKDDDIRNFCSQLKINKNSFRVSVVRADKKFPIKSDDYAKIIGSIIYENNSGIKVDLHNFELEVIVDIRENGKTYITTNKTACVGGLPLSTAGKGLLLLSGGIDSPVAGYMMSKRGMTLCALHFHSFPYTSLQAKQKVIKLRDLMQDYCGNIKLYCCKFTKVQEEIHKNCAPEFMITIMRRIMMRIAERVAKQNSLKCIITGESLGQVASQTVESITSSNSVVESLPVLRPLIAFDKIDIMDIAKKINTYETSILPYEDCCTVFLPKNPVIHPKMSDVLREESKLNIEKLIEDAMLTLETI